MTVWLDASADYKVGIEDGKVVAQNKAGKTLKTVPAKLKDDPTTQNLKDLIEWLAGHERQIITQVNDWMVQSLPISTKVLSQVWADSAWRQWLTDLVIVPSSSTGELKPDAGASGFLRSAESVDSVGVVTLDGETELLGSEHFLIAHPINLGSDLDDYRDFAAELGIVQGTAQLMRETFAVGSRELSETTVNDYADGDFAALQHATSRAQTLGYTVKGGFAVCNVNSNGTALQATYWLGSGDPSEETSTGALYWVHNGETVPLAEVGAVAFSEGMRMAATLYAGRKVQTEEEAA